jgi:TonB family protein
VAARETVAEITRVRLAAEQDKRRRDQLAAAEARTAWISRVEKAIELGHLISPAGASAKDLLAERNSWRSDRDRLSGDLVSALFAATRSDIREGRLASAEKLLGAATALNGNEDSVEELQLALENAFIEAESNRVLRMEELVVRKTVAPKYPRRAEQRGLSGWVIVEFTINASGGTADVRVTEAEPESVFDDSVIEAVEQWQFEPREYRGQTISQRATTRLGFRLAE